METNPPTESYNLFDQKAAIQTIVFVTVAITFVLAFASFSYIYSQKKDSILDHLELESVQLKSLISDNLNYSNNFIDIVTRHVKANPDDLDYISKILKVYVSSKEFMFAFGWRKFSWISEDLYEVVTSNHGIIGNPKKFRFITQQEDINSEKLISYKKKDEINNSSLKIIRNVFVQDKYHGSVVLSYDLHTMVRSLNIKKKHLSTNFVILNENLEIVAQSNLFIQNLLTHDAHFVRQLQDQLDELNQPLSQLENESFSYVDMLNGLNYYITKIEGFPFILVINIDNNVIRNEIINEMFKNFLVVSIFASLSLAAIIFVYKRETSLRAKSEKASLIANHATKAKTNFLAFTAHEIRSPLGFILTGSEIMQNELMGTLSDKYKKYAQGINHKAQEILNFITDILDENQIISGKFKIKNELCRLKEIIDEAVQNNLTHFNNRKVNINCDIETDLPLILCDKRRILQVVNNLLSNSIKYSEDNTTIEVQAFVKASELVLIVRDQGIGIEEGKIPIALNPHCTTHDEQKFYSTSSYGLGLSIVKMLVEAHDAELRISSVQNKGTTVKIIFPKYKLVYDSHKK